MENVVEATYRCDMFKFRNTKLVSQEDLNFLKSLGYFIMDKFFTENKLSNMTINVIFKKDLYKNSKMYGNCIWEDQHHRPEEFTIEIEPNQKRQLLLNTLAHELVHVKQWAKGEYYQLQRESNVFKFNGQRIDADKVDYWDQPWEIEAHGRAIGLVVQWANKYELPAKKLVVEG